MYKTIVVHVDGGADQSSRLAAAELFERAPLPLLIAH